MKAALEVASGYAILKLTPENESEKATVLELATMVARKSQIMHRGFQYLSPEVEFYIQPQGRGD